MICPKEFIELLESFELSYMNGVPDSYLKELLSVKEDILVSPNEGSAVSHAVGYHLATQKIPVIYMQNSGLGNAINPLTSIAANQIFGIPMLLLVGWRGQPGSTDEPQHSLMGKNTKGILDACELPYEVLKGDLKGIKKQIGTLLESMRSTPRPVALIIKKDSFNKQELKIEKNNHNISRYEFLKALITNLGPEHRLICTTGHTAREVYKIRNELNQAHSDDFYSIGGMGHTSQIALGVCENTQKQIICLDGDGSLLMHLGNIIPIINSKLSNINYIVFNNESHLSVGGQKTSWGNYPICDVFRERGCTLGHKKEIGKMIEKIIKPNSPIFLEVKVENKVEQNLPRPTETPNELKKIFMEKLNE